MDLRGGELVFYICLYATAGGATLRELQSLDRVQVLEVISGIPREDVRLLLRSMLRLGPALSRPGHVAKALLCALRASPAQPHRPARNNAYAAWRDLVRVWTQGLDPGAAVLICG